VGVSCGFEGGRSENGIAEGVKRERRDGKGETNEKKRKKTESMGQFRMNGLGERRGIGKKELQAGRQAGGLYFIWGKGRRTGGFCFLLLFSSGLA
jgi:hypothetical protein